MMLSLTYPQTLVALEPSSKPSPLSFLHSPRRSHVLSWFQYHLGTVSTPVSNSKCFPETLMTNSSLEALWGWPTAEPAGIP